MNRNCELLTENSIADIVSSQQAAGSGATEARRESRDPEFALLCGCCRTDCDSALVVDRDLNWDRVFDLAKRHALLPALVARLRGREDVPASVQSALQARFTAHCRRVLRFNAELLAILRQFANDGIPVVAHKGPVLAQILYGDAAMREFGDLDLLVRPSDVGLARTTLRQMGYEQKLRLSPGQERQYLKSGYEHVFGRGDEKNLVELQWQVLPRYYSVRLTTDELLSRSVELQFESLQVRVLGREDLLLVLCVHAAKHNWMKLSWIRDIATLASMEPNWNEISAMAKALGIERILHISLALSQRLFGVAPPVDMAAGPAAVAIAATVQRELMSGTEIDVESPAYFRRMLQVRERRRDRARFLSRLATTPSVGEWETISLPDSSIGLYRGVRVFRLLKRALGAA